MITLIMFDRSDIGVGNTFALRTRATPQGRASGMRRIIEPGSIKGSARQSKRPPFEKVAFENAPCMGGYCRLPKTILTIPSAVHVFVPFFPDASHTV